MPVRGKLGLVAAVAVAWVLTFAVMGGDVRAALSSHDQQRASAALTPVAPSSTYPPATPIGPDQAASGSATSDRASRSNQRAAAAAAAEKLARTAPLAGQTLAARPNPRRSPPPVASFRIATFNMLGASHTRGKGGRGPGVERARRAAQYLLDHHLDLVGFQEFEPEQRSSFMAATGGQYAIYPGAGRDGANSIAYRVDTWEMVKPGSIRIAYFNGRERNMPVILLKHKQSGIGIWFSNFHNPASIPKFGNQAHWRGVDAGRQANLFSKLRDTDYPMIVTGDMNERSSWFCKVAGPGDLRAAAGGDARGGCHPPSGSFIDWIAGSYDLQFTNYLKDKSGFVNSITDHPVMSTDVTVDSRDFPRSVVGDCRRRAGRHRARRKKSARIGPAVCDPESPVATNTATARSPWDATIQACVGRGGLLPYSAVPVLASTSGGSSVRSTAPEPSVTTECSMDRSDLVSTGVSGCGTETSGLGTALSPTAVRSRGTTVPPWATLATTAAIAIGEASTLPWPIMSTAASVSARRCRHLPEVRREAEVVVDPEPECRRGV